MPKVTRILYSKNLNQGKYKQLVEIAMRLGKLRKEIWHKFGSISGIGLTHRQVRDKWIKEKKVFDIPARLWKETLRDTFMDIRLYQAAMKSVVRDLVSKQVKDKIERKRLIALLNGDSWVKDKYLCRLMRKYCKHGKTKVNNQIILDTGCYTMFEHSGKTWIKVMGLESRKRISIPLNSTHSPSGTLRLIINNNRVEVHYAVEETNECSTKPCGNRKIGIDKGYSEVFVDSDGVTHGEGLGTLLSKESDELKTKYQRRNKLLAIAKAKPHKLEKISKNNLGKKKLTSRKKKHDSNVKDKVFKAAHSVVDKANTIACEDLSAKFKSKKKYSKNQRRRLSGWVKKTIDRALRSVSQRRGSSLVFVNCAYTSQMDSRYGVLLGYRNGEKFYCFDKVVLNADINAARNVLARVDDSEIQLYTPYSLVKTILLKRTEQFKNGWDCSTMTPVATLRLSTESELPLVNFR